ncbi:MAG TPA: leucine-rich repeat domain-containing protein [Bacilli bacterium]|nr:leucine-rich repeat domain-containing protein [Bacilli bacterium]
MSSNTNTLFWVICGAVIVTAIFLLISTNYGEGLTAIFGKFNGLFTNNTNTENSEMAKYYNHEPDYENLVITNESDFIFNSQSKEITGYKGNSNEIVIPYEINGIKVEKVSNIGMYINNTQWGMCDMEKDMYSWEHGNLDGWYEYATQRGLIVDSNGNCIHLQSLTKVVIPNTVKTIGDYAFYYQQLTNIIIPDSVIEIGIQSFSNNMIEGEYVISKNVERIDLDAFYNNKLTTLDFSKAEKLTYIGAEAFMSNNISNKIIFPKNLEELGMTAFIYNKISEIDLSVANKISLIDYNCFYGNLLTSIEIPSNITEVRGYAFSDNKITEVKIRGTNTSFASDVFHNNNNLTTIKVPSGTVSYYRSQSSLAAYAIVEGGF